MNYNNILDIIKNNIQLFNCIKLKFQDGYKIELGFKLDDKDFQELYLLNKDIELLIYENLNHLKDILENHLKISD